MSERAGMSKRGESNERPREKIVKLAQSGVNYASEGCKNRKRFGRGRCKL